MPTIRPLSNGSVWRRWDPHIHAPGTLLSDQFDDDWEGYLTRLESSTPRVEVLGITDYFSLDSYKTVLEHKSKGRLKDIGLIFPNIEMRLTIDTERKKAVNAHFLFCPDAADHIDQIERALHQLTFSADHTTYHCTRRDLIALGRSRLGSQATELAALREGANQFKVTFDQIARARNNTPWMKENCLIAVSGSSHDGTAGLQGDDSFATLREEIERSSHLIFSATESSRAYWLGQKPGFDRAHIERRYGCLKPCIHGSDAHRVEKTLQPDEHRYCWIKGDATFESLRQVVLEPEDRVHIGAAPPHRIDTGDHIARVTTQNTPWLSRNEIDLNPGLVAIIGGRGSGKTALADIIARAANSDQARSNDRSFLHRAAPYLGDAAVEIRWGEGPPSAASLWTDTDDVGWAASDGPSERGQVRYLSQQFVERLCSAGGLHSELIGEIERVIFNETSTTEHLDCESFQQLADLLLEPIRQTRQGLQEAIADMSARITTEEGLHDSLPRLTKAVADWEAKIKGTEKQMNGLLPQGDAARVQRLSELEGAFTTLSTKVDKERRRLQRFGDLRTEIANMRQTAAPQGLERLKQRFHDLGLPDADWSEFLLDYVGDVDAIVERAEGRTTRLIATLSTTAPGTEDALAALPTAKWPLDYLEKAKAALEKQVGMDRRNKTKYASLQQQLDQDNRGYQRARDELAHAEGAAKRKDELTQRRRDHYRACIQTFIDETRRLEQLYSPLHRSFAKEAGTIKRLRFSVYRSVDLKKWIDESKELFDLRMESNLRGHDALREAVRKGLYQAWVGGDAEAISKAMATFITEHYREMLKLKPPALRAPAEIAAWKQKVAAWLYNTDHLSLSYSMTYDNVPIERLSQGTRGIVLLLLFLVIDRHDKRPLIIDQPEENLDPRSVYQELVGHFREARKRRQVIIVTHNANLVVNADADQVIVATPVPNESGGLPTIEYDSGSLEDPRIRKAVCQILEGGERAFLDRERRYRIPQRTGNLLT